MDTLDKLRETASYMRYEPADEADAPQTQLASCDRVGQEELPIYQAALPGGRRMPLLKTLLTTACERDCFYCCFRSGRDFRRSTFKPDELAQAFINLLQANRVKGLFLSSGMAGGGVPTQDRLIATAEILRQKLKFQGYLHLKIMPGAEHAQVERAMQLADRVSINLEGPNSRRLAALAPHKIFMEELLQPLRWVEEIRRTQPAHKGWNGRWPSSTTQFVVGGVGERDVELLGTTAALNQQVHLARAYFSGFNPVENTPLENQPPSNPRRQQRLYQASFLLRDYGFDLEEMPFNFHGDLPLDTDPKLAWARQNFGQAPLEINRADREQLLRIPGIGLKGVQAILKARYSTPLRSLNDLKALGIVPVRAAPFILLDGKRPDLQLELFPCGLSTV